MENRPQTKNAHRRGNPPGGRSVCMDISVFLVGVLHPVLELGLFGIVPAIRGAYEIAGDPADALKGHVFAVAALLLFQITHFFLPPPA